LQNSFHETARKANTDEQVFDLDEPGGNEDEILLLVSNP